jgi:hypothetical protein
MDANRKEFIAECRKVFEDTRKDNKILIHYILDRKGRRVGVLLAAKPVEADGPLMGWSLCNIKRDQFNKYIGIAKALDRLQHGSPMIDDDTFYFPTSIETDLPYFAARVERYFKTVPDVTV